MSTSKEKAHKKYLAAIGDRIDSIDKVVQWANKNKLVSRCYIKNNFMNFEEEQYERDQACNIVSNLNSIGVDEIVLENFHYFDSLNVPFEKLGVKFYDTELNGLEMVILALSKGISNVAVTLGGIGKVKYYNGPLGNIVASDLVFALDCLKIGHSVDSRNLLKAEDSACNMLYC